MKHPFIWTQYPPHVRSVRAYLLNPLTFSVTECVRDSCNAQLTRYSFPWVSLSGSGCYAFFHNQPWKDQDEAFDMAKYHALPYRFCHGNSSRFGYVICLQVTSGHDEGISNSNYGFVNFFGTTFTDYFHILNNDVPERKQMEVMRDIEHPHRVLEYDWSRRLEPF